MNGEVVKWGVGGCIEEEQKLINFMYIKLDVDILIWFIVDADSENINILNMILKYVDKMHHI